MLVVMKGSKHPENYSDEERDTIDDVLSGSRAVVHRNTPLQPGSLDFTVPSVSGAYIEHAQSGSSKAITSLIRKRDQIAKRLAYTEGKLYSCNQPAQLAEYDTYCREKGRDFAVALKRLASQLEERKTKLQKDLLSIENKLLGAEPRFLLALQNPASATPLTPISLVPASPSLRNVGVQERDSLIRKHQRLSTSDICKRLDDELPNVGQFPRGFPDEWFQKFDVKTFRQAYQHERCRPLVHKLISKARAS